MQRSSLATPQRAVFLDRDGTLIPDKDCLRNADELELLPDVAEAVHELNLAGWRTVVVTNQPVIAKGFCDEAELQQHAQQAGIAARLANTRFSTGFIFARIIRKKVFPANGRN